MSDLPTLSEDAKLFIRLMPFGGHVRVRPKAEVVENPYNEKPATAAPNPFAWAGPEPEDDIEGFSIEADHLVKFLRASGEGRQTSKDRVTAALAELMLADLVKVFQDDTEAPRYALTETGLKVQQALS